MKKKIPNNICLFFVPTSLFLMHKRGGLVYTFLEEKPLMSNLILIPKLPDERFDCYSVASFSRRGE